MSRDEGYVLQRDALVDFVHHFELVYLQSHQQCFQVVLTLHLVNDIVDGDVFIDVDRVEDYAVVLD